MPRRVKSFEMGLAGQVLAEHVIEIGIESTSRYFPRVLELERTRRCVARVGEERFFLLLAFFVQRLKPLPGQQHFAAEFEPLGNVRAVDFPRDRGDGLDVIDHVVALLSVAAREGFDEYAVVVPKTDGESVIFEFADNFCVRRQFPHPVFDLFARITVGEREHRIAVLDLFKALFAEVRTYVLGRGLGIE